MPRLGLRAAGRARVKEGRAGAEPKPAPAQPQVQIEPRQLEQLEPKWQELGGWNWGGVPRRSPQVSHLGLPPSPPPGAPDEARCGPQGMLRAHQAERHLRALLRQQQQRHPAQAPQHGGPGLWLPLRPCWALALAPTRTALHRLGPPNAVTARAGSPYPVRAGPLQAPLPPPCLRS